MKILHVISSMHPDTGGPCQGLRNTIPFFSQEGHTNEVVCMDAPETAYGVTDTFTIHKVGKGKTAYSYQPRLVAWLATHIQEFEAVLVHGLWQYHNYAVYQVVRALKKQQQPCPKVAIMPHGMLDPYFQKAPERRWKALRNEVVWALIEKHCINQADAIFFTCEEELRLANTTFSGYRPKSTINVGYGIQAPPLQQPEFAQAFYEACPAVQGKKYLLFLSRIHHKKGIDVLIKAYTALCQQKQMDYELVIAGPTKAPYAQQMQRLAASNPRIHFPGMLKGAAKWGAFYECSAFVLPSHQENFGIAIVEAMACHKPVLITPNINIWREIIDGGAGCLIEKVSTAAVTKTILEFKAQTTKTLAQQGEAAFATYQKYFEAASCAKKLIAEFKKI
jgi:glycosyltransferase involved in cell wall biosynthesis